MGRVVPDTARSDPGTVRARGHGQGRRSARSRRKKRCPATGGRRSRPGRSKEVGRPRSGRPRRVVPRRPGRDWPGLRPFVSGLDKLDHRIRRKPMSQYRPVPPQVDLPALEHGVLEFWREHRIFEKSLEKPGDDVDLLRGSADRQRAARHPPRRVPRVQGHLPAVPDHAGLPGRPQGRLGLPRPPGGARGREGAGLPGQGRHRGVRRRGVQRALPRVGAAARRPVGADDRPHGLLDRHARPLPHDGRVVRRVGVVGTASRSTARACWSRTTGSRRTARAAARGCPTTSWRRATRPSPTRRSTCASRSPPARTPAGRRS